MRVNKISLKNFRNIKDTEIVPCEGMNVICGENAQGKTNILEAIWLFTGAKSFRNSKDREFVNFESDSSKIELDFLSEGIEKQAVIKIADKRECVLNENKLKSPSLIAGNFNAIVFSPLDLRIVTDGPSIRRKFLDVAIGQIYPSYIEILKKYIRAVTQRNSIIKDFKYDSTLSVILDSFEEEIAVLGDKIVLLRKRYIDTLNNFLPTLYDGLSGGKEKLSTVYIESCENLAESLKLKRQEDMFSGSTSVGPHRDDIEFKINGVSARMYGSQGQKRSVALALKLAEAQVIKNNVGECPVFLLDDVMSELDPERQNFILNHIKNMQVFLTCCDPDNVKNLKAGKIFTVKDGALL